MDDADWSRPLLAPDRQQQLLPVNAGQRRLLQVPGSRRGGSFNSPAASSPTPQTPSEAVEHTLFHKLVPHGDAKNKHCQLCYKCKTEKDTRSEAQRRKDSYTTDLGCAVCRMRICPVCHKDGTHL